MGIVNTPEMQIVYSDTPGVLRPNYKLQQEMREFSESALGDADVLVYVTDVVEKADKNADFLSRVSRMECPVLLVINKIDLAPYVGASLDVMERDTQRMRPGRPWAFTNLKTGEGLDTLIDFIVDRGMLPPRPPRSA